MNDEVVFPKPPVAALHMELRDHFAGLAMQALIARTHEARDVHGDEIAHEAYTMADRMLAARDDETI